MSSSFTLTDQVDAMLILNMTSAPLCFKVAWETGESAPSDWFGEGASRTIAFRPARIPRGSECVALIEFADVPPCPLQPPVYYASDTGLAGTYTVAGAPGAVEARYLGAQPSAE